MFDKILNTSLIVNPLSTNPTKRSNTLKQFVGNSPPNYYYYFDQLRIVVKFQPSRYLLTQS